MYGKCWKAMLTLALTVGLAAVAAADVRLPAVFGDHMVLQADQPVPVWGWADPEEQVTVALASQTKTATADSNGRWSIRLDPLKPGGPHSLSVKGKNALECADVLVGEVWLCSGQSNMAMTVGSVVNKDAEIAAADYPKIRMFITERKPADKPQDDCAGKWLVCSRETVAGFSATAYFFGRELHQKLDMPVGLLHSSWGGTPIQAWTSWESQQAEAELKPMLDGFQRAVENYHPQAAQERYVKQLAQWEEALAKAKASGQPLKQRKPQPPVEPRLSQGGPARLYNGMIVPLKPYALRGAIWYQGEANAGAGKLYGVQLRTMIANWRADWQSEFPFLSVQLPNFMEPQKQPSEMAGWPLIREQFLQSLVIPNTGIAVTIDVGEAGDIHPRNKQDVGKRLAQWALAKTYGKDVVACGPLYKAMRKDGNKIVVEFDYADGLAARDGGKLRGFAIAGEDQKFVWADAAIEGSKLIVSSPEVTSPAAVRYAWANNPDCNLVNKAGLPASPFRTDDWSK